MAQRSYPSAATGALDEPSIENLGSSQAASGVAGTPADAAPVYADNTGRQVKLRTGVRAWVRGRVWESDPATAEAMAVPTNTSGLPRTDRLVLRLDRSTNNVTAAVLTGTPALTPAPPALTQTFGSTGVYELPLARWTVADGYTTILAADVTTEAWYPQPSGLVACTSTTRPLGAERVTGRSVYEYDTGRFRRWDGTDWTFWRPRGVLSATSTTLPTGVDRVPGQVVYQTDIDSHVNWNGTAWVTWPPPPPATPSGTDVQVFHPITIRSLNRYGSATAGTSYTTGTLAPAANALVMLHVVTVSGNTHTVSVTGLGLTWTAIDTWTMQSNIAGRVGSRTTVFTAQCGATAPASGELTITATASVTAAAWQATEILGHDPVNPIARTTVSNSATAQAISTVTYPAATVAGSRQYAFFAMTTAGTPRFQQQNWAEVPPTGSFISGAPSIDAAWRPAAYSSTDNGGVVSVTLSSAADYNYARGYEIAPRSMTWTKPANAKTVDVVCIGGGGGGGGGFGSNVTNSYHAGSSGGSGAGMTIVNGMAADNLPATVPVTVGGGGAGGYGGKATPASGGPGGAGDPSFFGSSATTAYAYAVNGNGGAQASTATVAAPTTGAMFLGGAGGAGGDTTGTATSYGANGGNASGPGGGAGGAGYTASGTMPGGSGGYSAMGAHIAQPAGGTSGTGPGAYSNPLGAPLPGSGGSGSASAGSSVQDGWAGTDGGWYGGGGGGAGMFYDTGATYYAGHGGTGGPGVVVVVTHF